ncbi:MAG: AAA family ATPase [Blastopirellula sp. JB062]
MQVADAPQSADQPGALANPFTELTCAQLVSEQPPQAWLLPGMLQQHEPAVIVGPSKSLKSSLAVDLCGALASGGKFLGQFAADRAFRVGFVGGDAARGALTDLAQRWSAAAEVDLTTLETLVWSLSMADLSDPANLQRLKEWISRHQLEVVLIDVADLTPRSRRDQTAQMRELVRCCLELGATPIVCCPTRREPKPRPLNAADLVGAACHGLARQWLLVNHRQEYEPGSGRHALWLTWSGCRGQGGAWGVDVNEGRGDDPLGRKWEVTLRDVESIERENLAIATHAQTQRLQRKLRLAISQIDPRDATKLKIRQASRMSGADFGLTWDQLAAAGEITSVRPLYPGASLADRRYQLISSPQKKNERRPVRSAGAASAKPTREDPARSPESCAPSNPPPHDLDEGFPSMDTATLIAKYEKKSSPSPVSSASLASPRKPPRKRRVKTRKRRR